MHFEIVGKISEVETIAVGPGVKIRSILRKRYGRGRWRKLQGVANVRLSDGRIRVAECIGLKRMESASERCESHDIWIKKMAKKNNHESKFAVCINADDADLLTPGRIYQVLPDESAAKSNYIRVIDNEGEDYLYPADYFLFIELPRKIEMALLRAA